MEIQGKVIKVLDGVEYTSKKSGEKDFKYSFVIETNSQYPQKVAFSVFGKERFSQMAIALNGTYSISFDISSREWNDRWYTEATAFRAVRIDAQSQGQAQVKPQPQPQQQATQANNGVGEGGDGLPF